MFYDQDIEYDAQCVMEAVLEKKSLDKMLSTYLKQLDSKLKTVEDCDEFLEKIKVDASRFNDNLRTLQDSKAKYEKGTIDYKEYKTISRKASREVASSCRTFKINLSRFGGKGAEDITKEDIMNFKSYLSGIIKGVNSIKKERQRSNKTNASESVDAYSDYEIYKQEFNQAISKLETL